MATSRALDAAFLPWVFTAFFSDKDEHRAKPFVTDDLALMDLSQLVELTIGEISALVSDLDVSILQKRLFVSYSVTSPNERKLSFHVALDEFF